MYFVKYFGNLITDPLSYGVNSFEDTLAALDYLDKMRSKGYNAELYEGKLLNDDQLRFKILEELTAEAQAMGLYD